MSITVIFPPTNLTAEKYQEVLRRLEAAGVGAPPGREYHNCHGTPDRLGVLDVWESHAAFEAFGETLMPILEEVGVEAVEPQISETHNIIT
ncbi:MAG: hypothetical protein BMS9Abin29_2638 [Gemmatimonadota bacterium]|nr:MAG: hypothetical protein BMS9Abin29_2638 [Gemmatimonadota bacterium]